MANQLPVLYDYINTYNAQFSPSTIHARNTGLSRFFQRWLMQKIFSVYEFTLPETWDEDYFRYVLFSIGFGAVLNTDKYGVIFQHGTPSGYNVYYRPTRVLISNPALSRSYMLQIGEECEIVKLTPDWRGVYDIVSLYADMMAVTMESFGVNVINSKLAYVFAAESKTAAESMKKLYDQVASGEPAAFADKALFNDDGDPMWMDFSQNLKQNFIGLDLLEALTTIENKFSTMIGINNANLQKRERLITDEVNANNEDTRALCEVWLESMQESMQKTNDMFDINISVKLRKDEEYEQTGLALDRGTVQL